MQIREALTFDDVLLTPARSQVLPKDTDTRTRLTQRVELGIPLISAAMDTVTEAPLAIAMAQAGGLGIVHKSLRIEQQAAEVRKVKKFEAGMVVNPVTIAPEATLADALKLMADYKISGIPVVERGSGRLAGIVTNRDVRFATKPDQPIRELMTKDNLVTVREGVDMEEAKRLLHAHRIEKLLVVDGGFRCVGLITVKDIEKAKNYPNACKDEKGRLRVGAAVGVGDAGVERAQALFDAEVDVIVVDTAHGHSEGVLKTVERVRKLSNYTQVIGGNVATGEGASALIDAGVDAVKVGIGPASICTTRVVTG
ncbi:MAG TPA: IMP dehydrogenase, partial [Alphaproteobacteria bacterium]|nr:IMP dehydrogenase [Alphaproteobacteria bacterium]